MRTYNPDDVEGFVNGLVSEHPGEVVLVAGAADTIREIIRKLGGRPIPSVLPDDFDDLFLVTVYDQNAAKVLHLQYGEASP